ncbi:4-vinyl reductase [uncultured Thermanaerothrix sp.]|uniref:4-vinyl reductase n=1 Tax=uncultured Thermanaerothrix sp. TaxID=1195149 RepID=UPI0026393875|nr:4-vinyl reductase [uncultured Thermanaerothrix sp.]
MEAIPKSGYYYPNKIARIALLALEDVMGKNGVNAILNLANLQHLIDNYPPDNLERQFDFADFSAINGALEEMYGPRGGRGLALRAGRATFQDGLRHFGALAGVGDLAFKVLPLQAKLRIGLPAMAKIFSTTSDQYSTVEEKDTHFIYTIHRCPVCWGRKSDRPDCYMAVGLLQEGLKWVSGGQEFRVNESKCVAMGDPVCEFVIFKEPIG